MSVDLLEPWRNCLAFLDPRAPARRWLTVFEHFQSRGFVGPVGRVKRAGGFLQ